MFKDIIKTDEDRRQIRIFLLLDFLYVSAVFLWTIFVPVSSSDYLWFHNTFFNQPIYSSDSIILSVIFSWSSVIFRLLNFILLYMLMVALFFITRFLTGGPWWLGSLSAVLFMAHPLTEPHVIQINGYETLFPLLIVAIPLLIFAYSVHTQASHFLFVWLLSLTALFANPLSAPFIIIISIGLSLNREIKTIFSGQNILMSLITLFPALYFLKINQTHYSFSLDFIPQFSLILYPIGWLPTTQSIYHQNDILPILYGFIGISILLFISWKVKHKYLILLLWGIVFLSMFSQRNQLNLSQPLQNTPTLFPLFLSCIVISGICGIIQKQPRWKTGIVKITTLLCIIMMVGQIFLNGLYAYSSSQEQRLAKSILKKVEENNINEFILFPSSIDYRWHRLNIFATLLRNKGAPDSPLRQVNIIPYCKFYPDPTFDVELTTYSFSENTLVIGIYPAHAEHWQIYPSKDMIPDETNKKKFFNPQNNTWIEFFKEEQTENVTIYATDRKLSKNIFLWDNRGKTYKLIIFK